MKIFAYFICLVLSLAILGSAFFIVRASVIDQHSIVHLFENRERAQGWHWPIFFAQARDNYVALLHYGEHSAAVKKYTMLFENDLGQCLRTLEKQVVPMSSLDMIFTAKISCLKILGESLQLATVKKP